MYACPLCPVTGWGRLEPSDETALLASPCPGRLDIGHTLLHPTDGRMTSSHSAYNLGSHTRAISHRLDWVGFPGPIASLSPSRASDLANKRRRHVDKAAQNGRAGPFHIGHIRACILANAGICGPWPSVAPGVKAFLRMMSGVILTVDHSIDRPIVPVALSPESQINKPNIPRDIKMKGIFSIVALAAAADVVSGHYIFNQFGLGSGKFGLYQHIRQNTNHNSPVTDLNSRDLRCNVGGNSGASTATVDVKAGDSFTFRTDQAVYHQGPISLSVHKSPRGMSRR